MRLLILQLSDIHLRSTRNPVMERLPAIAAAASSHKLESDACLVAITGDVAFSGRPEEYTVAKSLLQQLNTGLKESLRFSEIHSVLIPGNHDCNHQRTTAVRQVALNGIGSSVDEIGGADTSLIETLTEVQTDFFRFCSEVDESLGVISGNDRLKYTRILQILGQTVRVDCYNTAWMSQLDEVQGKLLYPKALLSSNGSQGDLVISLFHHPYAWLESQNARIFKRHMESSADIILTGHEHTSDAYEKRSLATSSATYYVEGAVLQDVKAEASGFNLLVVDTSEHKWRTLSYVWNSERYLPSAHETPWEVFVKNRARTLTDLENSSEYAAYLRDPGAAFTHPRARQITLKDIFVYPDIRIRGKEGESSTFLAGEEFLQYLREKKCILLLGDEKSGKTTLGKILYLSAKENGLLPLVLDGANIRATNPSDFEKLIRRAFDNQYLPEHFTRYRQTGRDARLVVVDDFHRCRLNPKGRAKFLDLLTSFSENILIVADTSYSFEEAVQGPTEITEKLKNFTRCTIKELGHVRREELIEKWCSLGIEDTIENEELLQRIIHIEKTIDTLRGRHLIPSHPIFILAMLQQIEAGTNLKTFSGAYGYIYEALITDALMLADASTTHDAKYVFLSLLAYRGFKNQQQFFSEEDLDEVCEKYFSEYKVRLPKHDLISKLELSLVLFRSSGRYAFRYKYIFYYFVAKYFQEQVSSSAELRLELTDLTRRLYNEDAANILIFYIYLTKDQILISDIISNSRKVFAKHSLWNLERHTRFLSDHSSRLPPLEFHAKPGGTRKEILKYMDEVEEHSGERHEEGSDPSSDADERGMNKATEEQEFNELVQLNVAFKTIQIMGQILRNFPGSLKGQLKAEIAKECYLIGLRSMGVIFEQLEKHWDEVCALTARALAESKPGLEESKRVDRAIDLSVLLATGIAIGMIKAVSYAVGSEHLKETYKTIMDETPSAEFQVIDISIKLDHFRPVPEREIAMLNKKMSSNQFGLNILRFLVVDHMYMLPCDYRTVQRLCAELHIPLKQVRLLEARAHSRTNK